MKQLFVVVLLLLVCITSISSAAELTPRMFLAGCGLTVMDQSQLQSMGDDGDYSYQDMGVTLTMMTGSEGSTPAIMYYDGTTTYVALNMLAAFGGTPQASNSLAITYADFCDAFDFDVYGCIIDGYQIVCVRDTDTLQRLFGVMPDFVPDIYHDKADFTAAVREKAGNT